MTLDLVIILLLVIANGIFAGTEVAIISVRRSGLEVRAEEGDRRAQTVLDLIEHPNVFLSTIQIGITLVSTVASAFGGVAIVQRLTPVLARVSVPFIARYAYSIAFVLVVLGITFVSLILGELVPKRLALAHAERISRAMAPLMKGLAAVARPLVWLLGGTTNVVLRLLGQRAAEPPPASEEEIKYLMAEGARVGIFAGTEQELVERVFRFVDLRVGELMHPRSEMVAIDVDLPPAEARQMVAEATFSRFPVYKDDLDNILGVVHAKDVLVQGKDINLRAILRQPLFVPESQLIQATLRAFQATHSQLAIVVNEYGGTEGLVTLEDVLEQLVGEIEDEYDRTERDVVRREDGSLLVDGLLPAEELRDLLHVEVLPGEESYQFNTLAGFVIAQLGRLPRVGDSITAVGHRIEVVDMEGRRIDRVLITALPAETPEPSP
jgi:putative hemolysin